MTPIRCRRMFPRRTTVRSETRAWDVCNAAPFYGESFTLDNDLGLDNDGDNVYDENDTDCGASPCPEDLDGDGVIGFQDLLIILSGWGPCSSTLPTSTATVRSASAISCSSSPPGGIVRAKNPGGRGLRPGFLVW